MRYILLILLMRAHKEIRVTVIRLIQSRSNSSLSLLAAWADCCDISLQVGHRCLPAGCDAEPLPVLGPGPDLRIDEVN